MPKRMNQQVSYRMRAADVARQRRRLLAYFAASVAFSFVVSFALAFVFQAPSSHDAGVKSAAASSQSPTGAEPASEDGMQESVPPTAPELDAEALAKRDVDFAVDPSRVDWNYSTDGQKTVYLTIDDGPSENTQAVLDILDSYGCKATFFVVGHNDDYFPMIAEAYRRGHTIGLHTYSHDYEEVYSSADAYFADLDAIGQVVAEQIGYVPCFIRFPGGSSNEISNNYCEGIMNELIPEVQARGYQYYDWNLSVGDGADHTADEIASYGTVKIDDENIMLLCHDSATKQTTVEALPSIIEHYQSQGYVFKAIDRESWVCHHETGE